MLASALFSRSLARGVTKTVFPSLRSTPLTRSIFSHTPTTTTTTALLRSSSSSSSSSLLLPKSSNSLISSSSKRNYFSSSSSTSSSSSGAFGLSRDTLMMIGVGAGLGLLLNAASGLMDSGSAESFATSTRQRLLATYTYVAGSLGFTAAASIALFRTSLPTFMMTSPWLFMGGSLIVTIGSSMLVRSISYENFLAKHAALALFCTSIAASLCPLVAIGGSVVLNAAAATAAMVGGLSILAASAPSETFLAMHAPLSVGLGVVFAASLGGMFFPQVGILHNIVLYGGLAVFGGFTVYDTSRMIQHAKYTPVGMYDPVNQCLSIYMDTVNIFVRMVQIMMNSNNKRK